MGAKGYWVVHSTVTDMDAFQAYVAAAGPVIAEHGGTYLMRGGQSELCEGSIRPRTVVIEFPSYAAALDCHHSPGYEAAATLRADCATFDLVIVEGYET
jgi:uncharacterized protein (DUF1330 family)